ncbi:MAG: lysine exporter LysO family protein [Bacteroidales bacterium]
MTGSLIIISFFITGIILAKFGFIPASLTDETIATYILYALMFSVGISLGSDKKLLSSLKNQNKKIILVPLGTIAGTLIGAFIASFFIDRTASDCMAVGSGFGYYSLSSIFITQFKGEELGTIALMANIMREIFALLTAPFIVGYFGKLAPISAGGATTMDTTLPIITRYSGKEFVIIAIIHGFVVDFSVPFLVTFFCKF